MIDLVILMVFHVVRIQKSLKSTFRHSFRSTRNRLIRQDTIEESYDNIMADNQAPKNQEAFRDGERYIYREDRHNHFEIKHWYA